MNRIAFVTFALVATILPALGEQTTAQVKESAPPSASNETARSLSEIALSEPLPPNQWVFEPGRGLKDYLLDGGQIVSTTGLMWPDGRPALIVYVAKGAEAFRCVDFFDSNFSYKNVSCSRLVSIKKPPQR